MKEFLLEQSIFTVDELDRYLSESGTGNSDTRKSLLSYYLKKNRIVRVRRGLYLVVPPGYKPETVPFDPYLIASKVVPDSVLSYHSALEIYGRAHSSFSTIYFVSNQLRRDFHFRGYLFNPVSNPVVLRNKKKEHFEVIFRNRSGYDIAVTSIERTFVDIFHRPYLCGGWEEIWKSLETIEFFNIDTIIYYLYLLDSASTVSKVGYFLSENRKTLMVEDKHFEALLKMRPKQPLYWDRAKRDGGVLNKEWNIIIPEMIFNRAWEEFK